MSNNENDHFNEEDIKASFLSAIKAYAESVPFVFELINKIEQHENHFTVNKDLEKILKEIKKAETNNSGNNQNNQSVAKLAISHMYASLKDSDHLVKGTINRVSQYIDLYDITTKGIDSYKVRYFMGIELIETVSYKLVGQNQIHDKSISTVNTIIGLMILIVMHMTLLEDKGSTYKVPEDMYLKFGINLLQGSINQYFGEYGLFLIFKTLSKVKHSP